MEVVHPRIPRALGWRCLNSSSAVRSPRRSIFRDVLHDGIRVPLFPHVHFFHGLPVMCVFSFFVHFQMTAFVGRLGGRRRRCVWWLPLGRQLRPLLGHLRTAWTYSGSHARLLAPYRGASRPRHSRREPLRRIHPWRPFRVLLTPCFSSLPRLSTVLHTWGSSTSGHDPRRPGLSCGHFFHPSLGSYAVWNEKRGQHFGPPEIREPVGDRGTSQCSGWRRPCFSEPRGGIESLPACSQLHGALPFHAPRMATSLIIFLMQNHTG